MLPMDSGAVRFRRDLPVERVETDGYTFFEVKRPGGEAFRLYEFEHQVALELDGKTWEQVCATVRDKHDLVLTPAQIEAFAAGLAELELLEAGAFADAPPPVRKGPVAPGPDPATASLPRADSAEAADLDAFENEPTAGLGRPSLLGPGLGASRSVSAELPVDSEQRQRAASWHEAEPTALMNSLSDLLAVSRAKTGETVIEAETEAEPEETSGPGLPFGTAASPRMTMEIMAAAARFDDPFPLPEAAPEAPSSPSPSSSPTGHRPGRLWVWALVAIALAVGIGFALFRFVLAPPAGPVSVTTVLPAPVAVYRWFETTGTLQAAAAATLSLPAGGQLAEVREAGMRFAPGDVLAVTEEGKKLRKEVDHLRERIAYYQQMLETMTAEGNKAEARQAELKLKDKQRAFDEAFRAFRELAVVAPSSGVIERVLASAPERLRPGAPVFALQSRKVRGVFRLTKDEMAQAERLAFCRALVQDKPFDCAFVPGDEPEALAIELPAEAPDTEGLTVALARARYDGVFAVPARAVVQVGNTERLFVAAPSGRAEVRAVSLAERGPEEALVAQGLEVGDAVIIEAPPTLAPNVRIQVGKRILQ